jgi:hypothetical protein
MATALLISHSLIAVALLGALTHQTLATCAPARAGPGSFLGHFCAVPSVAFVNAIVALYAVSAVLGAVVYVYFRVLYVLALAKDVALVTVHPTLGIVVLGAQHAQGAAPSLGGIPAIYWYGWTATAALAALMPGLLAAFLPERWTRRISLGWSWVAPAFAMVACVYLTLPWFRR